MERAGVIRTLAEPNLTAISGETANFLAGGEFPIPAGFTCDPTTRNCQTQIQFKKFGVGLNFTPVVMSEGRISLKVLTEVSELSNDNALTLVQSVSVTERTTQTIPSIKTRRAETTVEIPSGGSLAMAGMIHEQTKQQLNGMPGLMNLPVLGALFKSRDYINRQSELMVMVTPYIVRAVAQKDLSRPDDGYADASDASTTLLGRFNRLYGDARPERSRRPTPIAAMSASSWTETRRRGTIDASSHVHRRPAPCRAILRAGLLIAGLAATLAGCNTQRHRHHRRHSDRLSRPPSDRGEGGQEGAQLFVGAGRGGLSPMQRAEVLAFAQNWKRDATGGVTIDRPVGGANERAVNDTLQGSSVDHRAGRRPNSGIGVQPYQAGGEKNLRPCG